MNKMSLITKFLLISLLLVFFCSHSLKVFSFSFLHNKEGKFVLTDSFKNFKSFGTYCESDVIKLKNGNVLLTIGLETELYNVKTHKFENTGNFNYPRDGVSKGIVLKNGKVFFVGTEYVDAKSIKEAIGIRMKPWRPPNHPEVLKEYEKNHELYEKSVHAELYNPDTGKFEVAAVNNIFPKYYNIPVATILNDGRVFILREFAIKEDHKTNISIYAGKIHDPENHNSNIAEIYDPESDKFTIAADLHNAINGMYAQEDGRVIIFMGKKYTYYDPKTNTYSTEKDIGLQDGYARVIKLKNGNFLFWGGENRKGNRSFTKLIQIFDPVSEKVTTGKMLYERGRSDEVIAVELNNGKILFSGGRSINPPGLFYKYQDTDTYSATYNAELFDINTGKSKNIGSPKIHRYTDQAVLLDDGSVLIIGNRPKCELFIPKYREVK